VQDAFLGGVEELYNYVQKVLIKLVVRVVSFVYGIKVGRFWLALEWARHL